MTQRSLKDLSVEEILSCIVQCLYKSSAIRILEKERPIIKHLHGELKRRGYKAAR